MSNVKCPSDEIIKKQIAMIIDSSGIFENEADDENYVECKPVRKGSVVKTISMLICAAAICLVLAMVVIPMIGNEKSGIEPLGHQSKDDTVVEDSNVKVNLTTTENSYLAGDSKFKINYKYVYPKVTNKVESVDWIDDYYSGLIYDKILEARIFYSDIEDADKNVMNVDSMKETLYQQQLKYKKDFTDKYEAQLEKVNNMVPDTGNGDYMKELSQLTQLKELIKDIDTYTLKDSDSKLNLDVTYYTSVVEGISAKNGNVISILGACNDTITTPGTGFTITSGTRRRSFGQNFDLSLGRNLTYEDLFSDKDSGVSNFIYTVIDKSGQINYGGADYQELSASERIEATKKKIIEENNWSFSSDGIMVFLNDAKLSSGYEEKLDSYTFDSVFIKFSEIMGLKDEYRN